MDQPAKTLPKKEYQNTLLMLGDSLVAGYDWQQRIPQLAITNFGVPGLTTEELLQSLPNIKTQHSSADLILVMIGTNDVAMENYGFFEKLKQIIVFLSQNYPNAEVMVNNLMPIQLPHLGSKAIERINQQIEIIGRETGSCYLDTYSKFLPNYPAFLQADGVHITPAGYDVWAKTLLEHIAFLLDND